jgi:Fur family ferric uptake transcriptional regulator
VAQNKDLKRVGLKVTHPRVLVLGVLQDPDNKHVSAEDIYRKLRDDGEEIGLATIYRVLNQFDDAGIVDKHNFDGGKHVFELSNTEHHDHLVCLNCGKVIEFEDEIIERCQEEVAKKNLMELTHHSLYLYGTCKNGCEPTQEN